MLAKSEEKTDIFCKKEIIGYDVCIWRKKDTMYLVEKISKHAAPHLHNCLEMILVTKGTLEIGMGQELFHMEKGDMAVIFPDVIHHCQVFGEGIKKAYYLWGNIWSNHYFEETLQKNVPRILSYLLKKFILISSMHLEVCRMIKEIRIRLWYKHICRLSWQEAYHI